MNTNENKEMLWELLRDNNAFQGLTNTQYNNVITIFNTTLNQTSSSNKPLMEQNKEFISSMLQKLNAIKINTFQDSVKNNIVDTNVMTHQEIQKQKRNEFENNLEKRQQEFTKYMKIHIPDEIDFSDKNEEEPIKNVETLIHEKMKERSYDVFDKPEEKTNENKNTTNNVTNNVTNSDNDNKINNSNTKNDSNVINNLKKEESSSDEEIQIKVKSDIDNNVNNVNNSDNNNIQKEENIIIQNLIKRIEVLEETQQEMKTHMNELQEKLLENINAIQEKNLQNIEQNMEQHMEQNIENTIESIHNNPEN